MCFRSINLWLGVQKGTIVRFIFRISCVTMNQFPQRNPRPVSIPHLDFRFPKFFGANFGYSLPFSVTGLSPVLLHKPLMLFLSRQFLPICVVSDKLCEKKKKKSFGTTHFRAIFHVGSGSQHIHRAWQKTSHTLRGTFRDAELLFQPQFTSFDAIHSCLSFCEAEIGHWTVNFGEKK